MFRWSFQSSRMRHPLVRLLAAIAGAAALLVVLAFGLFAAAALVIGGAVFLLIKALRAPQGVVPTRAAPPPVSPNGVIEGEFTVTRDVNARQQAAR